MRPRRSLLVLLAVAAGFAACLHALFAERIESGDIFPAYSTLRSDPLGCRALYAALEGPLEARRAYSGNDYRAPDPGSVWFFLGSGAIRPGMHPEQALAADSLARNGARVVVAFAPEEPARPVRRLMREAGWTDSAEADSAGPADSADRAERKDGAEGGAAAGEADKAGKGTKADPAPDSAAAVTSKFPRKPRREIPRLGIRVRRDTSKAERDSAEARRRMAHARGPDGDSLPWISAIAFDSLDPAWTVLYRRDTLPVVVERSLGKGSLVLLSDSYWASNEALFRATPGRLLALLIGDRKQIVFDELHLGIAEGDSLGDLLARHGLHGMLPSLLLLLSAWLWRARGAFDPAPPLPDASAAGAADAPARRGMRGLLRRYVPAEGLLAACYGLWRETEGRTSRRAQAIEEEAGRIVAECGRDSAAQVEGYRRMQNLLKEGKPR